MHNLCIGRFDLAAQTGSLDGSERPPIDTVKFRQDTPNMQPDLSHKPQYPSHFKRSVSLICFFAVASIMLWTVATNGRGGQQASAQAPLLVPGIGSTLNSQRYPLPSYPANTSLLASTQGISTPPPIADGKILSADLAAVNTVLSHEAVNTQISVYIVRDGDTISDVAKMFRVSVNTVLWANDLTSRSILRTGQSLVILPVTGITYVIKSGDTVQGIAKAHGADVDDILNYNDITLSSKLRIGDELLLPNAEPTAPTVVARPSATGSLSLVGSNLPSYSGYFACPLPGAHITQRVHGNNGVDLASPKGTPILATAAGSVIINRANGAWNGGYGNFVVVLHSNGTQSLYSHMLRSAVSAGQKVTQGQIVGYVGMTGQTTGPHVHFEIRGAVNPFADPAKCR